jgi:AmiR/NasT family two-component response regulator
MAKLEQYENSVNESQIYILKVLPRKHLKDADFANRFRREAQSAAGLNHPAIVSVYDTGEDHTGLALDSADVPYIVMEYVDGRTLRELLRVHGSDFEAVDVASLMVDANTAQARSTAEEAVEQAPAADLVLMDIQIDGPTDGIRAAAQIRERYHVPVIFLTAHADRATLDRAKLAEPFGYIVKPLANASLHTSLEIAVYKHRMERQLEERETWLRTTLSSVAEAVIVTDVEGRVLMMNQTAQTLTGWIQPEAEGQPVSKVV